MHGLSDLDSRALARNWWLVAFRGVAAIVFGILTLVLPGVSLAALVLLFGSYSLVEGVLNVIAAIRRRNPRQERWWALLVEGLVSIGAGVVTFVYPGLTAVVLLYIIAAWAIVTGVVEIVAAVRLRKRIPQEWRLALSGVLSVIFGVAVAIAPAAGALALVLWIGAYAVVFGALLIALALRLREWGKEQREPMARAA